MTKIQRQRFRDDEAGSVLVETAFALPLMALVLGGALTIGIEATLRARADRAAGTAAIAWLDQAARDGDYTHPLPATGNGVPVCAALVAKGAEGGTVILRTGDQPACGVPDVSPFLEDDEVELIVSCTRQGLPMAGVWTAEWRVPLPVDP